MQIHRGREVPVNLELPYEMNEEFSLEHPHNQNVTEYVRNTEEHRKLRVQHVRGVLKYTADKREESQRVRRNKGQLYAPSPLKIGMKVLVATYQRHNDDKIQPIILRLLSTQPLKELTVLNPLKVQGERVHVTKAMAMKLSLFFKHNLKTNKFYNTLITTNDGQKKIGKLPNSIIISSITQKSTNQYVYRLSYTEDTVTYKVQNQIMNGSGGVLWSEDFF